MSKATFLFWNLKGLPRIELICEMADHYHIDLFILAECNLPIAELLEKLNINRLQQYSVNLPTGSRITLLSRFPQGAIHPLRDAGGVSIRRLSPPVGADLLLVALHLPSKLYQSDSEQMLLTTRVARYIDEAEQIAGHSRTIVCGDFNMNPFEAGMIGSEGFHAVMSKRVATKKERTVSDERKRFFYNPMWSMLGDESSGPPGTYYWSSSTPINYFWNMFDQVLIRPDLLGRFTHSDLQILTSVGRFALLSDQQIPDQSVGSDHLPILFKLDLSKEMIV